MSILKPITKVAIACFKNDMPLIRACVASIRFWYPSIEIYLIKDYIQGNFSTEEIETAFNVKILKSDYKNFGWPWSKLSVLFQKETARWIFLDSDTVLLGPVLDKLATFEEDFIVTGVELKDESNPLFTRDYIDSVKIKEFDPEFKFPGYGFNGGQIVMTSGIFEEKDYSPLVDFNPPMQNKYPHIFKHGDQGIMNYVFAKANQTGKASVRYDDFWVWPGLELANEFDLSSIKNKQGYPYVLHWAGLKPVDYRKYKRADIFEFYEQYYYSKLGSGSIKRWLRNMRRLSIAKLKILKYTIQGKQYEK